MKTVNNINITTLRSTLKNIFGFNSFKANQENIINAILEGKDVFAVMPTGGGKSLCYQLPAVLMEGTCVVVSPLISLMKDQVDAARSIGINASFLNSSLTTKEMALVFQELKQGNLDLLYISPERFALDGFIDVLKEIKLCMFAIDEAHCISEWGHDFRPDYLSLSSTVDNFPDTVVASFTASATQKVQEDIVNKLKLRSPLTVRASFNRPNLFYQVIPKKGVKNQILKFIKERPENPGIVYRTTRKHVESTADFLRQNNIKALHYHAGLSKNIRKKHQEDFNRDEISVIVATIAFGMGIDKSNVRFIIHGDMPKNIEGYYQETGRAGRDGEPAHCLLLFSGGDIRTHLFFISQLTNEAESKIAKDKLFRMVDFATFNVCRRKQLIQYFGEEFSGQNEQCCDICTGLVKTYDATVEAQIVMSAIARTGERFGIQYVIDVVKGKDTERIDRFGHDQIKTFGKGKEETRQFWHRIINDLLIQACLVQTDDKYPVLQITQKGRNVLFGKEQFLILKQRKKSKKTKKAIIHTDYDNKLFELLRRKRMKLAKKRNVPPYIIFSDKTLHEMCSVFPTTETEMLDISGIGEKKMQQFGDSFIKTIKQYVEDNSINKA